MFTGEIAPDALRYAGGVTIRSDVLVRARALTGTNWSALTEAKFEVAVVSPLRVTEINTMDGYKYVLEDGGWLLIRFSGTEPIIRVYCETTDEGKVKPLLDEGLRLAGLTE